MRRCFLVLAPAALFALALLPIHADGPQPLPKTEKLEPFQCGKIEKLHTFGGIFLAGQPSAEDLKLAQEAGLKTVLNLREKSELDWDEEAAARKLGLEYIHLPFKTPESLTDEILDKARKVLADPNKRPLMLHCGTANRVGAVWLVHRVLDAGLSWEEALKEAKTVGLRNAAFEEKAKAYIEKQKSGKEANFGGLWQTSYGRMRLLPTKEGWEGIYHYGEGGTISGAIKEGKLQFSYREPNGVTGVGWFELAADGKSFKGKWKENGKNAWQDWNGKRVEPVAGRVWLIVLEAPWEHQLADAEYSWGAMLRTFFTRSPHVQVRQRFFNDEASFRKWAAEVAYLAEPVVLVLSSHGCEQGITVGKHTIGCKTICDCLRYAGNIRLLHFASCLSLKDRLAQDIHAQLAPHGQFPISGYRTSVDWAASAVLEFMYFDLVLSRNLSPSAAAEQLVKLMPYAGDKDVPGAPFRATGFRIVLPEKKPAP